MATGSGCRRPGRWCSHEAEITRHQPGLHRRQKNFAPSPGAPGTRGGRPARLAPTSPAEPSFPGGPKRSAAGSARRGKHGKGTEATQAASTSSLLPGCAHRDPHTHAMTGGEGARRDGRGGAHATPGPPRCPWATVRTGYRRRPGSKASCLPRKRERHRDHGEGKVTSAPRSRLRAGKSLHSQQPPRRLLTMRIASSIHFSVSSADTQHVAPPVAGVDAAFASIQHRASRRRRRRRSAGGGTGGRGLRFRGSRMARHPGAISERT